ncbi:MAG: sigma-70 family RNA polymerase sigma factor [Gammaproteobacteria bacterium]|nr:sigma-70 family RNA polymerase sigma factor [Gammaproteobacteria bacterium]
MEEDPLNTAWMPLARDRRLVKQILAGDERALNCFINEYFPRLYRYARHRLNNDADVEDVVQAVLSQAARRLETWRGEATLLTWLVQICRHEISRHLQQASHRADMMLPFLNDDLLRSVVESMETGPADDPEAATRRSEVITLIQFALDQLPEHYAAALELKYVEGFSSREIAQRLKTSDEALQSLLARARRAFREVCGEALTTLYGEEGQTLLNR